MRESDHLLFTTLLLSGFLVAFLHAAIPTHWLPFVAAARAQRWKQPKTLLVTTFAGGAHVLFTTALGALMTLGGLAINAQLSRLFPFLAGGALIAIGLFYLLKRKHGGLFHHCHGEHEHEHEHGSEHDHDHKHDAANEKVSASPRGDRAVIGGLLALLTFSPCEAFLPVFLTGAKFGWMGFVFLSATLALATVAGMVLFTWLSLLGMQRLNIKKLEQYESALLGAVFCLLGLLIIFFEH